jgi:hypothetical protein
MVEVPNPKNPDKPLVAKFGNKPIRQNKSAVIKDSKVQIYYGKNDLVHEGLNKPTVWPKN